jgi:hypothetical protein
MADELVRVEEQAVGGYLKKRKIYRKTCAACPTVFEGPARQKYCSHTCAARAWYQAHAEEGRTRQRERYRQQKDHTPSSDDAQQPDLRTDRGVRREGQYQAEE